MKTRHTKKALTNYRKILVEELKRQLKKPNSRLEDSITGRKITGKDGFAISMNDYGINVNQGRSAGRFPNIEKLKDWIIRKKIKNTTAKEGKPSSLDSLAYIIGRSIAQRGIKPTRFIDIVIEKVEPKMTLDIANAYLKDLNEALDKAIPKGSKK
jgi:hypothetical protein